MSHKTRKSNQDRWQVPRYVLNVASCLLLVLHAAALSCLLLCEVIPPVGPHCKSVFKYKLLNCFVEEDVAGSDVSLRD